MDFNKITTGSNLPGSLTPRSKAPLTATTNDILFFDDEAKSPATDNPSKDNQQLAGKPNLFTESKISCKLFFDDEASSPQANNPSNASQPLPSFTNPFSASKLSTLFPFSAKVGPSKLGLVKDIAAKPEFELSGVAQEASNLVIDHKRNFPAIKVKVSLDDDLPLPLDQKHKAAILKINKQNSFKVESFATVTQGLMHIFNINSLDSLPAEFKCMFVLNAENELVLAKEGLIPELVSLGVSRNTLNHGAIADYQPVIGAGNMTFNYDLARQHLTLRIIDNDSGHFRPPTYKNLLPAILKLNTILENDKFSYANCLVHWHASGNAGSNYNTHFVIQLPYEVNFESHFVAPSSDKFNLGEFITHYSLNNVPIQIKAII
jgi:hypothetical protein